MTTSLHDIYISVLMRSVSPHALIIVFIATIRVVEYFIIIIEGDSLPVLVNATTTALLCSNVVRETLVLPCLQRWAHRAPVPQGLLQHDRRPAQPAVELGERREIR